MLFFMRLIHEWRWATGHSEKSDACTDRPQGGMLAIVRLGNAAVVSRGLG